MTTSKSCGKTRFLSRAHAEWALETIRKRGAKREKKPVRTYPCGLCKGWHLTSEPK